MIPRSLLRKISRWLNDYSLVWCIRCERLLFKKDACAEMTTNGLVASLCKKCHHEVFTPFGR